MAETIRIVGSYLSPYVRKALVVLETKGLAYEIDPIVPFFGDDRFSRLSPLRRVPVLIDDRVALCDSSVICQYLEERWPDPALYPRDLFQRARARWLEEFADTRMGDVFVWRLFHQRVTRRFALGEPVDEALVARTLAEDAPAVLDYLESELPEHGYACGELSIADVAIACFFRNAGFARFAIDAARWPRTAALVARVQDGPAFRHLAPFEELLLRTPLREHRAALAAAGAPLCSETLGGDVPRRGAFAV